MARGRTRTAKSRQPSGKRRTAWHPLFVSLLEHYLGEGYTISAELPVGKEPLRIDVVVVERAAEASVELPEARSRLEAIVERLRRVTLIEFKSPQDHLAGSDFDVLLAYAHLYRAEHPELALDRDELQLLFVAPARSSGFEAALRSLHLNLLARGGNVYEIEGAGLPMALIETTGPVAGNHALGLVGPEFLSDPTAVMERLSQDPELVCYHYQQVVQFQRRLREDPMQYEGAKEMMEANDKARLKLLELFTPEERLRGISEDDKARLKLLELFTPEERLRGISEDDKARLKLLELFTPEERLQGISEDDKARLKLLELFTPEERLRDLPPEERLRGITEDDKARLKLLELFTPEERLRGLPPEERLRGLPPEMLLTVLEAAGLDSETLTRVRELLAKRHP